MCRVLNEVSFLALFKWREAGEFWARRSITNLAATQEGEFRPRENVGDGGVAPQLDF